MLSPRYLAGCSDDIVKIYAQLEHDIVTDMARRLAKIGEVTEASEWQAKVFSEIGGLRGDIKKHLSKYDKDVQENILNLFNEALDKNKTADLQRVADGVKSMSGTQAQILKNTVEKLQGAGVVTGSKKVSDEAKNGAIKVFTGLQRLTMTIAETGSSDFVNEANAAYMKVVSGAFDYNTALKHAVNNLASKGVEVVGYTDSGKRIKRTIEGAVRANILTGINQAAQKATMNNCKDLGCGLVEVSAHMGARPSHAAWQGGIYSLDGKTEKYESFYDVCRPGEPDGIGGVNCRHSYYPYFEGTEPQYTGGELDEMREAKVTYNGKKITQYEAEQKLRYCERNVRKYKRVADANAAAGLDNTQERKLVGKWQAAARDIVKQTGIPRDYNREFIGTAAGKQVQGIKPDSLNIKTAKKAEELFPDEKWEKISKSVYVSESRKPLNKQQNDIFEKEMKMAKTAAEHGHFLYFLPERNTGKNPDMIMDGVVTEFKNVTGNIKKVGNRFSEAMQQANNVCIKIESKLSVSDVYEKIYGEIKAHNFKQGTIYVFFDNTGKMYKWTVEQILKNKSR